MIPPFPEKDQRYDEVRKCNKDSVVGVRECGTMCGTMFKKIFSSRGAVRAAYVYAWVCVGVLGLHYSL